MDPVTRYYLLSVKPAPTVHGQTPSIVHSTDHHNLADLRQLIIKFHFTLLTQRVWYQVVRAEEVTPCC